MIHQYRNNGYNIVMDVYSGSVHVVDDVCYDVIAEVNKSETEPTAGSLKEADVKEKLLQTLGNKYETSDIEDALSDVIELTEGGQLFVKDTYECMIEEVKKRKYLFVAGGVGSAPVYPQVKWMHEHGIEADVIEGSKTKDLLILEDELKAVAGNLYVTTDDGSYERKGMVTDVIKDLVENQGKKYDVCVAIGPMIMMKFVCKLTKELGIPTIVSLNPIMVDGTGMCGACRVTVGGEVKFACVDGPEFDGHLVDFDQAMKRQQMYKTEEGRAILKAQEGATHHGGCGNCGGDE